MMDYFYDIATALLTVQLPNGCVEISKAGCVAAYGGQYSGSRTGGKVMG